MRAIVFVAAVVVVAGAACSGDTGGGGGNGGTRGGAGNTGSHAVATGSGGAMSGGSSGSFGNPNGPPTGTNGNPSNPMASGAGGAGAAGNSACPPGVFCAPTSGDPDNCGMITFNTSVKTITMPGNVLLIFDRSTSMGMDWNGMPRWQAAGTAMVQALTPLVATLTIGGVMYPSMTPDNAFPGFLCGVDPFTSAEQLAFQPGAMALTALQAAPPSGSPSPLYGPIMSDSGIGATPTTEAFQAADVALQNTTLTGVTVAILITDGEPNCAWDQPTTTAIVQKWLTQLNIKTYVVGLPGVDGGGPAVLNAIAQAGGTDMYITPTDSAMLQAKLTAIVQSTVKSGFDSCSIDLDPAAKPSDKLQLVLTEDVMGVATDEAAPHMFQNGGGGWTVSDDGTHVELVGSLCSDAMGGRFDSLKFTYGCLELPPLPPIPPPD